MDEFNDGGPAFPVSIQAHAHVVAMAQLEGITDTADRDRVYTEALAKAVSGMTLRDYFAAKALAALIGHEGKDHENRGRKAVPTLTTWAYEYADAMIKAREAV